MSVVAPVSFDTRITNLFGIRVPVLAGGMHWLSTPEYVAGAAKAGIMGFLSAASYPDIDALRAAIRECRALCGDAPFGVNVSMLPKASEGERTPALFQAVIDENVAFVETSGRNPAAFLPMLRDAGIKVLHKVSTLRHAISAQALGVDAVAIVGAECGGHPGVDMIGTFVQGAIAAQKLTIPVVIGGGVGTGAQLVAALALGADGVIIGTRFLAADEVWAHEGYKQCLINANEADTALVLTTLNNTARILNNETAFIVQTMEAQGADIEELRPHIRGALGRQAYESGDCTLGMLSVGQAVGFVEKRESIAAIIEAFEREAAAAMAQLRGKIS